MAPADSLAKVVADRHDFLSALLDEPRGKPGLVEATGTSRSTVDRAIEALESNGLVSKEGTVYRLTFTGESVLSTFQEYRQRLADLGRAHDVIGDLPIDADVDPAALEGATVREAKPFAFEYTLEESVELIRNADRLYAVGPAVSTQYVDDVYEAVTERGMELELVMTPAVFEMIEHVDCESFHDVTDRESTALYRIDESAPYGLWSAETADGRHSGVVVYTETGVRGVVTNDTDAMNEWAMRVFRDYRERATALESPPAT